MLENISMLELLGGEEPRKEDPTGKGVEHWRGQPLRCRSEPLRICEGQPVREEDARVGPRKERRKGGGWAALQR